MTDVQQIAKLISSSRFPLSDEKRLQSEMAIAFEAAGIPFEREVVLGNLSGGRDIIDFMCGSIGVEVKIKGAKRMIYRQLERYCLYPAVQKIVLVTNVPMGLPVAIEGKPSFFVSLARGWM